MAAVERVFHLPPFSGRDVRKAIHWTVFPGGIALVAGISTVGRPVKDTWVQLVLTLVATVLTGVLVVRSFKMSIDRTDDGVVITGQFRRQTLSNLDSDAKVEIRPVRFPWNLLSRGIPVAEFWLVLPNSGQSVRLECVDFGSYKAVKTWMDSLRASEIEIDDRTRDRGWARG